MSSKEYTRLSFIHKLNMKYSFFTFFPTLRLWDCATAWVFGKNPLILH